MPTLQLSRPDARHRLSGRRRSFAYRFISRDLIRCGPVSCGVILLLLACATRAGAQSPPLNAAAPSPSSLDARISIVSLAPPRVHVEGRRTGGTKSWSFRNEYASSAGLSERLENLSFMDAGGAKVSARMLAPGEFVTERDANAFSYDVRLDPPREAANSAHVSWLAADYGVLMLGDLLPLPLGGAHVQLTLPEGWTAVSAESQTTANRFELNDAENGVFLVGRNLRERRERVSGALEFSFVTTGEWAFSDVEAASAASKILSQHEKILHAGVRGRTVVMLAPFPTPVSAQTWSAETRGRTVFLLSGRWPSKVAGLAQLNVPLAHELLHLWIPNALDFDGDYDWFYEGFTLYQALRVGMELGFYSFDDYLAAIGRAYDGYRASRGRQELSLVAASRRRWSGASGLVYNKGMLVAFLYDLTLRGQTSNKLSLDDVYRELFRLPAQPGQRRDGNDAIVEILRGLGRMQGFTERYVQSAAEIELASAVAPFGLQVEPTGARTRLSVARNLSRSQRELLRKLGYNEKAKAP